MKVDLNKQYRTRSGNRVQLFTTGAPEPFPVVGIKEMSSGDWAPRSWKLNGCFTLDETKQNYNDLVEVRQEHTVYVNIRKCGSFGRLHPHPTSEHALLAAESHPNWYVAVAVPITYKDGDNLDLLPD